MIAADYSQIELRIMAHLSGDEAMREAFRRGDDIHDVTARGIFGVAAIDSVTPNQRRIAKSVNFGLLYGMSDFGLAQRLDIERGEARAMTEAYFARFPRVRDWIDGSYSFNDPSTTSCQPGQMLCNGMNLPIEQVDGSDAAMSIPANFYGSITFSAQIGYMGLYLGNPLSNCPSDWEVGATIGGSGTISIPQNDPAGSAPCEINFQTNPPGSVNIRGYYEGIALQYVDGVPCGITCTSTASSRRRRW